ncbi:MAG: MBL fold metallo-hydrolase [Spirochaetia bacterium]|jgi:glyoxylase-like metal-dependent hydrolase (beta-lactamase superfamily II)
MADKIQPSGSPLKNLYLLNLGFVGMYLYDAGESLIAFDTGMSPKTTLAELEKLRVDPKRVRHVLLTHSDRDHVGGLAAFPQAKVYLPRAEVAMLDHTTSRFFGIMYNKPLAVEHDLLDDNQVLTIGNASITCLSTPGHTAGSMSFLINGSVLVVGDILNLKEGKAVMDRGFMQHNKSRQRESILKLSRLSGVSLLCTAHSGYTENFTGAMKDWVSL